MLKMMKSHTVKQNEVYIKKKKSLFLFIKSKRFIRFSVYQRNIFSRKKFSVPLFGKISLYERKCPRILPRICFPGDFPNSYSVLKRL